jgi:hypothetical protein
MTLTLDRAQQLNAFTHELRRRRDLDEAPADRDAYRRLGDHHIPNITALRALLS